MCYEASKSTDHVADSDCVAKGTFELRKGEHWGKYPQPLVETLKQRYTSHDSEGVTSSKQDAAFEKEASKDVDLKTQSHYRSGLQTPTESVHTSPSRDKDIHGGGTAPASGLQQGGKEGPRSSSVINKYNIALRSNPLRPAKQPDDLDTALPEDEQYYHLLELHEEDILISRNYWQYMPSPSPSCSPPSSPPPARLRLSSAPGRNTTESYRQAEHTPARFAHQDDNAQSKSSPSVGHARHLADLQAPQPSHEPRRATAYRNKQQETHTPQPTNNHDEEPTQSAEDGQPPPKTAKREKKQTRRAKRKIELEARNKAREASRKIRKEKRMIEHVARVKAAEAAGLTAEEAGLTPLDRAGKPAGTVTEELVGGSEDVGSGDTLSLAAAAAAAAVVVVDPASVVAVAAAVRPARATATRVSARRKAFAACPGGIEE
ncbi:hypothetical protein J1614_006495 [Plenodomus biglobosus]|nr:hypothetical protein J1614_006495 [Plenodomus biglobosus]